MRPKQHSLPLRFESARVLHTAFPREETLIRSLGAMIAVLAICYITFVSMSIVNVIARKEALDTMTETRSNVAQLEHDYFDLTERLSASRGSDLGLSPTSHVAFVHRPGAVGKATTNSDNN